MIGTGGADAKQNYSESERTRSKKIETLSTSAHVLSTNICSQKMISKIYLQNYWSTLGLSPLKLYCHAEALFLQVWMQFGYFAMFC